MNGQYLTLAALAFAALGAHLSGLNSWHDLVTVHSIGELLAAAATVARALTMTPPGPAAPTSIDPSRFTRVGAWLLAAVLGTAVVLPACAPKTYATAEGRRAYTADQVVQRFGELQQVIVDTARAGKLPMAEARELVAAISGDANAVPPVTGIVDVLGAVPTGNTATALASWEALRPRLLRVPDLATWVPLFDQLIQGVQ